MGARPELWIVAGPNGAGKTTCVQREPIAQLLPGVRFLNPDDRTRDKLRLEGYYGFAGVPSDVLSRLFVESANEVFAEVQAAVATGQAIGVETVLSTRKYCSLVDSVVSRGGYLGLIYVALASPQLARERVAIRVRLGGHAVPEDRIEQRWRRSLMLLPWFALRASDFWVIDNSDSGPDQSPRMIAWGGGGSLTSLDEVAFPEIREALQELSGSGEVKE